MKLYYSPGACSLAVHIALRELGLPFEAARVDLATHRLADGSDYYTISPRGYVPVLEFDDGARHSEVASLLQYLADRDAAQTLIGPTGSQHRLEVVEWLSFVASELHKVFSPWLWHKDTAPSTRAAVRERLSTRFAELDRHFAAHEYLAGAYSVADAYAYAILNWVNFLAIPISDYPQLKAYLARMAHRPAVEAALRAEGLLN